MFIGQAMNPGPALQRSAMSPTWYAGSAYISLLWSEQELFGVARSINITSLRDEDRGLKSC